MKSDKKYVLSLFSSAGIGELGLKASGFDILLSNELLKERCALYRENYPETEMINGDIWEKKDHVIQTWKEKNEDGFGGKTYTFLIKLARAITQTAIILSHLCILL